MQFVPEKHLWAVQRGVTTWATRLTNKRHDQDSWLLQRKRRRRKQRNKKEIYFRTVDMNDFVQKGPATDVHVLFVARSKTSRMLALRLPHWVPPGKDKAMIGFVRSVKNAEDLMSYRVHQSSSCELNFPTTWHLVYQGATDWGRCTWSECRTHRPAHFPYSQLCFCAFSRLIYCSYYLCYKRQKKEALENDLWTLRTIPAQKHASCKSAIFFWMESNSRFPPRLFLLNDRD